MTTATGLSPFGLPTESMYTDLRDLPALIGIAWLEAQGCPEKASEILDRAKAVARHVAEIAELHLRGAVERAQRRENAADKEARRAEARIAAALDAAVVEPAADFIDPHGCFVYLLWGDDVAVPLYVGKSTNLFGRLGSHMSDRAKRHRVRRVSVIRCRTTAVMDATEWRLIKRYQPPMNTIGIDQ